MLLIGLDFGSTTSSAMLAEARIVRNCVTGRTEFGECSTLYRSEPMFSPFDDLGVDLRQIESMIDRWLAESGVDPDQVQGGGALVTGLAATASNAAGLAQLIRARFGPALVATADDPCLESWLAFMGNCLRLSHSQPGIDFLNLDIGGGTTNIAWGRDGGVRSAGSYYIGARHVQFDPGMYRVRKKSPFAEQLLAALGLDCPVESEMQPRDRQKLLDFYVRALESVVTGDDLGEQQAALQPLVQAPVEKPPQSCIVTLSGGVGELVYRLTCGEALPGTTAYGDLGIDLAERIAQSDLLSRNLTSHVPDNFGRATLYGLTIHNTELSGSTLFLPRPEVLPLADLPLLGRLTWPADAAGDGSEFGRDARRLLHLAGRHTAGACLEIGCALADYRVVKQLGECLAGAFLDTEFPCEVPLVLLVSGNFGKTFGQYATHWGRLPLNLIVLDEVPERPACFVTLGRLCNNTVPLSFYGMPHAKLKVDDLRRPVTSG